MIQHLGMIGRVDQQQAGENICDYHEFSHHEWSCKLNHLTLSIHEREVDA